MVKVEFLHRRENERIKVVTAFGKSMERIEREFQVASCRIENTGNGEN